MSVSAIGYKIRAQRKKLGKTQAAVARELGISAAYLNLIESNKRAVGGTLLSRLAGQLELDVEVLSGAAEQRLRDDLHELPADPMFRHLELETSFADELVARNPEWARTLLTLYRAYLDNNQTLAALSDRLNRDPMLQNSVHRMLTHITSIRSSAEILNDVDNLEFTQQKRFHQVIHSESAELTEVAQQLVSAFEVENTRSPSLAAGEEVDDFIIGHRNYFPTLEDAAKRLRETARANPHHNIDEAVAAHLETKFGIRMEVTTAGGDEAHLFRNQSRFAEEEKKLYVNANAPATTRRFQMVRLAANLCCDDAIDALLTDRRLTTDAARQRARHALTAYIAGAFLFPYEAFLEAAESVRYDIEILRQKYEAGYEQICHRLVTLRDPQAEGIPFAFLRVDPAGHISKRFPLRGFPLPRYGHACPLWSVFSAFQTPNRVYRQMAEFPDRQRFLMIARTVIKRAAAFHDQPVMFAVMLACDGLYADRTVYGEGLDLGDARSAIRVGSSCRLCNRADCQQRQEPEITRLERIDQ